MKKSTLYAIVLTALLICAGWFWFENLRLYFLIAAALSATFAFLTEMTARSKSDESKKDKK